MALVACFACARSRWGACWRHGGGGPRELVLPGALALCSSSQEFSTRGEAPDPKIGLPSSVRVLSLPLGARTVDDVGRVVAA